MVDTQELVNELSVTAEASKFSHGTPTVQFSIETDCECKVADTGRGYITYAMASKVADCGLYGCGL